MRALNVENAQPLNQVLLSRLNALSRFGSLYYARAGAYSVPTIDYAPIRHLQE